jgi:U4/U6 small nuclear ribonucleoprotein PRP3
MLVVEGGAKSLKKFQKLLLRRIKWGAEEEDDKEEDEMEEEEQIAGDKKNYCKLVWEGTVLKANFPEFKFEAARTEGAAKELLRRRGVGHYWDLVRDFTVE